MTHCTSFLKALLEDRGLGNFKPGFSQRAHNDDSDHSNKIYKSTENISHNENMNRMNHNDNANHDIPVLRPKTQGIPEAIFVGSFCLCGLWGP